MKQLILTALVSVICSVIAVKYLSSSATNQASSSRPQTAATASERETQRKGMNREAVEVQQRGQKGQRGQGERQGNKHGHGQARGQGGSDVTRKQGKRHGENPVSGNRGERENGAKTSQGRGGNNQHSHGPTLAGFALNNVEQSIAEMTRKLALSKAQQIALRELIVEYKSKLPEKRQAFTEAKETVLTLDLLDADYINAKQRQQKRAVAVFEALVVFNTEYREKLYHHLDSTQSRILLSIENQ